MKRLLLAALLPAFLALPAGVAAAVSATASVGELQVELVDLTPDDNILPSITFVGGTPSLLQRYITVYANSSLVSELVENGYGQSVASPGWGAATSRVTPSGLFSEITAGNTGSPWSGFTTITALSAEFVLGANTRAIFRAGYELQVLLSGMDMARAGVGIGLEGVSNSGGVNFDLYDVGSESGLLELSTDSGAQPVNGYVSLLSLATSTSPVPEPASWAMMLAGFALAGVAARRRQR